MKILYSVLRLLTLLLSFSECTRAQTPIGHDCYSNIISPPT